jgi:predicted  nucleic acid-binding Zn-ribbon protein
MMQMVCEICGEEYTLGKNGVMSGCDKCKNITRNKDGLIIYETMSEDEAIKHTFKMGQS